MDEAMRCDRVALVQGGRILQIDKPGEIGARYPLPLVEVTGAERYKMLVALRKAPHAHAVYPFGTSLHFTDARQGFDASTVASEITQFLHSTGFADAAVKPIEAGIEDSFMELMPPVQRAS